jgi:hypothetical protein
MELATTTKVKVGAVLEVDKAVEVKIVVDGVEGVGGGGVQCWLWWCGEVVIEVGEIWWW